MKKLLVLLVLPLLLGACTPKDNYLFFVQLDKNYEVIKHNGIVNSTGITVDALEKIVSKYLETPYLYENVTEAEAKAKIEVVFNEIISQTDEVTISFDKDTEYYEIMIEMIHPQSKVVFSKKYSNNMGE